MCVITVALALIWKDGRLLISRRRSDQHLGGLWEFPGGKCEAGETPEQCATREALEEVGLHCLPVSQRDSITHHYSDRAVCLIPVDCRYQDGVARPLAVQEVKWIDPSELRDFQFPEANRVLVDELIRQAAASGRD